MDGERYVRLTLRNSINCIEQLRYGMNSGNGTEFVQQYGTGAVRSLVNGAERLRYGTVTVRIRYRARGNYMGSKYGTIM